MAKQNHISFEEWVTWMFDRSYQGWEWDVDDQQFPWLRDEVLLTDYFIRVHEDSISVLEPYSNDQIGWGLWALYSNGSDVGSPYVEGYRPAATGRAIRSIANLIRGLVPERIPATDEIGDDALGMALFMYWDIAPIWPSTSSVFDLAMLDICIAEMEDALAIDHPTAAFHALHGLGHFESFAPMRTNAVIDTWLASNPRIGPSVRSYAGEARRGAVQ